MAKHLQDPKKIERDRLLLCEGKTTSLVLGPLNRYFEIQGFQHFDFGSKDNLKAFIADIKILPGFATRVKTIAIVRDAEELAAGAFDSVRNALLSNQLPAPANAGGITAGPLQVGVFIVPDNVAEGMIETLCMRSVDSDPAFHCVEEFFRCVETRKGSLPTNIHKARAQAFLSTRAKVEYHVGRAADEGVWNFDHPAFKPLADFLRSLADS